MHNHDKPKNKGKTGKAINDIYRGGHVKNSKPKHTNWYRFNTNRMRLL